jgi:chemotaxis protein MotB
VAKGHKAHEEHEEHEEHVNHEAWVIPYADMLTLLMALFLVLFAIGRTDANKAKAAAESFKAQLGGGQVVSLGGGAGASPIAGGNGVLDNSSAAPSATTVPGVGPVVIVPAPVTLPSDIPTTTSPGERALAAEAAAHDAAAEAAASLEDVEHALQEQANADGIGSQVAFDLQARGLVLRIVTDQVLFEPGSADLQPGGVQILDVVASALAKLDNNISVEGHTDSRSISTSRYPSNWELSTARATSVLRYLVDRHSLAGPRLSASGFSDTHPIDDNATAQGAARNRRVEIVILSSVSLQPVLGELGEASS